MVSIPRSMKDRTSSIRMSPSSSRFARAIRSQSGGAGAGSESTATRPIMSADATPERRAGGPGDDTHRGVPHHRPSRADKHAGADRRRDREAPDGEDLSPLHD